MRLTWPGHACVLLEGSQRVLIDPYVLNGTIPKDPDLVVLTHGHFDHFGETLTLNAPTVAVNELAKALSALGMQAEGLNFGGSITIGGVTVSLTPAVHSAPMLELDGTKIICGDAAGVVIQMDSVTVYHAGDTALFSDMKLIGELYHPDVALLPIGGRYTMDSAAAMMAAAYIGAPMVIPIHYNTWPAIEQDADGFKEAIERTTDMQVMVLPPGGSIEI